MTILLYILQIVFVPVVSPAVIGIIRKIKAKFQNRVGAGIFQPYKDFWKLFHKDEVVSSDASWISRYSPFIIFAITTVIGASIPLFSTAFLNIYTSDILLIVYGLAAGTFFLALIGLDTGGAFGGFGGSREMTVSALAEGGFIFSLLALAFVSGTTNLFGISASIIPAYGQFFLPIILAFSGFLIILLAETSRFPFDNPATHLELTMIHEAMIIESSGKSLALLEWSSANKLLIFIALGANLFFPWGINGDVGIYSILIGCLVFLLKILLFCVIISVLESSIAKLRFFRLPDLLIVAFILDAVAIVLIKVL